MTATVLLALVHRATVRRRTTTYENGSPRYAWTEVLSGVPCLLDARKSQDENTGDTETRDRLGTLTVGPSSQLLAGDVVTLTRGPAGSFELQPDPAEVHGFYGLSHREFKVTEVARHG